MKEPNQSANINPVPDPNGEPQPVNVDIVVPDWVLKRGVEVIAVGAVFTVISCSMTATSGATRSAHLRWQQRQQAPQHDQPHEQKSPPHQSTDGHGHDQTQCQ